MSQTPPAADPSSSRETAACVEVPPNGAIASFSQLVNQIEEGTLDHDATIGMQELVRALNDAMAMGRKASSSITLKIKLTADRGVIEAVGDLTIKPPRAVRGRSMFYIARPAYLSRRDPRQQAFAFRSVDDEIRATPCPAGADGLTGMPLPVSGTAPVRGSSPVRSG